MSSSNCWNLRVSAEVNQGGRKYMEDVTHVHFERAVYCDGQKNAKKVVEYASFAIFDGHGGKEAAHFARDHILENITKQKNFFSKDVESVKRAISHGFIATHQQMWNELQNWPKTTNGHPSTAGTTASLVIIRGNKMYVANVGDSMVVMGTRDQCFHNNSQGFQAMELTIDHKPELPEEKKRIEHHGGCVMNKAGVNRVVWNRPKLSHHGPIRRSTQLDKIPFLAIARSLGDLWSFNSELNEFIVSPIPDVHVYDLNHDREQFIVLASDGLWNMVRPHETVTLAGTFEERKQKNLITGTPAHELVKRALERWDVRGMRADNTSVIVVFIDRKKMVSTSKNRGAYAESWTSAKLEGGDIKSAEVKEKDTKNPFVQLLAQPGSSSKLTTEPTIVLPTAKDLLQDNSISSSTGDITDESTCSNSEQKIVEPSVESEGKSDDAPVKHKPMTRRMSKGSVMLLQDKNGKKAASQEGSTLKRRTESDEIQNASKICKKTVSLYRKKQCVPKTAKINTRSTSNKRRTSFHSVGPTTRGQDQTNMKMWRKRRRTMPQKSKNDI